jgi:hypothetical protein
MYIRQSVWLSVCPSIHPSTCLFLCLSVHLSMYLSVHLSVCLSIYQSIHLSVCPFIHLSVCSYARSYICPFVHLYVCTNVCPSAQNISVCSYVFVCVFACLYQTVFPICNCSGPWKRDRDVVLASAGLLGKPKRGGREFGGGEGMGRGWGKGGQFTSNLGPRWTGSHHTKGGFPSK